MNGRKVFELVSLKMFFRGGKSLSHDRSNPTPRQTQPEADAPSCSKITAGKNDNKSLQLTILESIFKYGVDEFLDLFFS